MPENVYDRPPDLLHFVNQEREQLLITFATGRDELKVVNLLQGLFGAALSDIKLRSKADLIVFQLLGFTHYHFLFATACLMRCHLSECPSGNKPSPLNRLADCP